MNIIPQVIYDYIITDYNYDYNDLAGSHDGYGHKEEKEERNRLEKRFFGKCG